MSTPPEDEATRRLAEAWTALWRDELTARLTDTEGMAGMLNAWARYAQTMTRPTDERGDTPSGTASPGRAFDPRDVAFGRLLERVDALERRVAELEAKPAGRKRRTG
jgi:hypothetical protein